MQECLVLGETVGVGGNEEGAVKCITEEKVTQLNYIRKAIFQCFCSCTK